MSSEELVQIHGALQSPAHKERVEIALKIINNGGVLPKRIPGSHKRTWYRVLHALREHKVIEKNPIKEDGNDHG